jgi:hypothetical protein
MIGLVAVIVLVIGGGALTALLSIRRDRRREAGL